VDALHLELLTVLLLLEVAHSVALCSELSQSELQILGYLAFVALVVGLVDDHRYHVHVGHYCLTVNRFLRLCVLYLSVVVYAQLHPQQHLFSVSQALKLLLYLSIRRQIHHWLLGS